MAKELSIIYENHHVRGKITFIRSIITRKRKLCSHVFANAVVIIWPTLPSLPTFIHSSIHSPYTVVSGEVAWSVDVNAVNSRAGLFEFKTKQLRS